jgi:radical SAM superfamily enzyme YgiQ (UPF0313 family)
MSDFRLVHSVRRLLEAEQGTLHKPAPLRVALCYPSPYHVGMSSLGFQAIYRAIHAHPDATAERVFLPDDVEAWKSARQPPVSIETQTPIAQFPVLAFSVAYELEVTGLFELLEGAGLAARREERPERAALVVAGGPLTFSNPDPLEPFVDVLVQGEAEDLVPVLLSTIASSASKREVLERLAGVPGFRVPGVSAEVTRGFVARASDASLPARSTIITPHTELSRMFLIEPERGCSRGCHYCELIPAYAQKVGLVGAAVTDHPRIVELLQAIVAGGREVGVSSLRADRLTQPLVNALKAGGAQALTVASDGPSQRLRDLVDRKHSETQLVAAANMAKVAGLRRLKVYNVVGLPTETDGDLDELVRFTTQLSTILPVALGVAPFVAKRNTPLDGAPFAGIEVVEGRLERLRKGLRGKAEVRPTSARWAWVEYMLAQCGPEAGLAAHQAWQHGGAFPAWRKAFEAHGCVPFERHRVPDGRRVPANWPSVGRGQAAPSEA